jgi:hypothetical protein
MPTPSASQRPTTHAFGPIFIPFDANDEPLAECVGEDRHLRAFCACGEVSSFDAEAWLLRGLAFLSMSEFSGRLRCPCGRRHARFEVWPGSLKESGLKMRSASALYE